LGWPRFDSGACFAALLGRTEHGCWQLRPLEEVRSSTRHYRGDSLVLQTEMQTGQGKVALIDFMPPRGTTSELVRIVRGVEGRVKIKMDLVIRFDYGASVPWVTSAADAPTELCAIAGPDMLTLRTSVPLRGQDFHTIAEFEVMAGESVTFVLTCCASHLPLPAPIDVDAALKETRNTGRSGRASATSKARGAKQSCDRSSRSKS
jgi:GH15 family glucan-1,4-alpha-glucosidase